MTTDEHMEAMKESPGRYTNPFLSDEENQKVNFWNNQEHEHSSIEHDLTNICKDDNFRNSLDLSSLPSEFCEKETELYTDKNVTECELPELLVCYKEGTFHVKDICVDEGIPHGEIVLFDENNNEMLKPERLRVSPVQDYYMESNLCSGTNGKIDTDLHDIEHSNDHMDIGDIHDEVTERKFDASSGAQDVDADMPLTGLINDHGNMNNTSIDTDIPVQDLQKSIPDRDHKDCEDDAAKECGTQEDVIDSVVPEELKNISKDDGDDKDSCKDAAATFGTKEEVIDTVIPNEMKNISIDDGDDADSCEDAAATECGTNEEVIDSVIPNELKNISKDYGDDEDDSATCGTKEEVIESVIPNELKNMSKDDGDDEDRPSECDPEKLKVFQESDAVSKATTNDGPDINSSDILSDNVPTGEVVSISVPSLQQDQPLPSLKSLLDSFDQQPCQSPVEDISKSAVAQTDNISNETTIKEDNTLNLHNGKPPTPENVHELPVEPENAHLRQDMASDNVASVYPPLHRGEGETSFSVAGPVSGLITYSGPIAYSGSISHRSDSSTTSTRSFAFPILQNEWNSSPVRMAKADRRRLQKQRGWRHGLLCCRF